MGLVCWQSVQDSLIAFVRKVTTVKSQDPPRAAETVGHKEQWVSYDL